MRLERPANATVYELTGRGAELRPVVEALGGWGLDALGEQRPTDAVRTHWVTGGAVTAGPSGAAGAADLSGAVAAG